MNEEDEDIMDETMSKEYEDSIKRKLNTEEDIDVKKIKSEISTKRVPQSFFNVPCNSLAHSLLGTILVRKLSDGNVLKARIVETECYPGGEDKASHSYNGKRTVRNEAMYMEPGTAYVYSIYGTSCCFNISSAEPGGAVLIRAVEPILGLKSMLQFRKSKRKEMSKVRKEKDVCNGPSKLCVALSIDKETCNKLDLSTSNTFWLETDEDSDECRCIIRTSRVGIQYAGPIWSKKDLRFYIFGNVHVSKRNKKREKETLDKLFKD